MLGSLQENDSLMLNMRINKKKMKKVTQTHLHHNKIKVIKLQQFCHENNYDIKKISTSSMQLYEKLIII